MNIFIFLNLFFFKILNFFKFIYIFIKKIFRIIFFFKKYIFFIFFIFIVKIFVFEFFYIPSDSMYPTLQSGDIVFVDKFLYKYKINIFNKLLINNRKINKNDIIVFICPFNKKINYIKRVTGVPGDKIFYKNYLNEINNISINYKYFINYLFSLKLYNKSINFDENYIYKKFLEKNESYKEFLNFIIIPKNNYFVRGDNKTNSLDSRYWGFLHRKYIIGKALYKIININLYSKNKLFRIYFNKIK